ncbi:MAG: ribosomal protein S18-alanine N-acetyltransferase [Anaerolineaceae bacterium]
MMSEEIIVKQLLWEEKNLRQILEIENSSFNEFDAYTLEDFKRWYSYDPDLCVVAEIEGRIVGCMISRIVDDRLDLASLAIHPAYRRRGIGSMLLTYTIAQMTKQGINHIELEVRKTNAAAIAFWEKLGFVPFGSLPNFYEDGADAYRMRKIID